METNPATDRGWDYIELYDLSNDIHEDTNLAEKYPDKVKELASLMDNARTESPYLTLEEKSRRASRG